jgi:cold-inducible RNA-binding protein
LSWQGKVGLHYFKKTQEKYMAKKLYVGGLPYATTDNELKDAFAQAGAVASAVVIMDRMTGRSKGFGFVEMNADEDAQKAIDMWNGKDFGGRTLTVNEARPMEERPRGNGGAGGYRGGNDRGGYSGGSRGGNGGGGGGRSW